MSLKNRYPVGILLAALTMSAGSTAWAQAPRDAIKRLKDVQRSLEAARQNEAVARQQAEQQRLRAEEALQQERAARANAEKRLVQARAQADEKARNVQRQRDQAQSDLDAARRAINEHRAELARSKKAAAVDKDAVRKKLMEDAKRFLSEHRAKIGWQASKQLALAQKKLAAVRRQVEIDKLKAQLEDLRAAFSSSDNDKKRKSLATAVKKAERRLAAMAGDKAGQHGTAPSKRAARGESVAIGKRLEHLIAASKHLQEAGFAEEAREIRNRAEEIKREHARRQEHHHHQHDGQAAIQELGAAVRQLHAQVKRLSDEIAEIKAALKRRK